MEGELKTKSYLCITFVDLPRVLVDQLSLLHLLGLHHGLGARVQLLDVCEVPLAKRTHIRDFGPVLDARETKVVVANESSDVPVDVA